MTRTDLIVLYAAARTAQDLGVAADSLDEAITALTAYLLATKNVGLFTIPTKPEK